MDTQAILNSILSADQVATDAYNTCLEESKHASVEATRKLNTLLEKTKEEAQQEAEKLWTESRAKIANLKEQSSSNLEIDERLKAGRQRIDSAISELTQALLSQRQ